MGHFLFTAWSAKLLRLLRNSRPASLYPGLNYQAAYPLSHCLQSKEASSMPESAVANSLSQVCGWVYFLSWSASFLPQIILNWRRGSVRGLSFDFVALNVTGFSAYALYTSILFFHEPAREAFAAQNPGLKPQVAFNDVVFAVNCSALCFVAVFQCFIYPRGSQAVRKSVSFGCGIAWMWLLGGLLLVFTGSSNLRFSVCRHCSPASTLYD